MQKIVPTQLSNYLQVCSYIGYPVTAGPNTTLNQKLDIQPNAQIPPGKTPTLQCYVIGVGGHTYRMGNNDFPITQIIDHTSGDSGLYRGIPFVLRPVTDDLTVGEATRYCLRKMITVDGVNYYAYYGKRLDFTGVVPKMLKRTEVDGQVESVDYVYTEANLSPVPPAIPNTGVITTSKEYLVSSAIVPMPFTEKDVAELYNVAEILFGDRRMAIISEFGFCTAVNADVSVNTTSGQRTFKEVIGCQISAHIGAHYELIFNSKGFDFKLEVGASQPLLATNELPTVTVMLSGG